MLPVIKFLNEVKQHSSTSIMTSEELKLRQRTAKKQKKKYCSQSTLEGESRIFTAGLVVVGEKGEVDYLNVK